MNYYITEIKNCVNQIVAIRNADNNIINQYKFLSIYYGIKCDYEAYMKILIQNREIYDQPYCLCQLEVTIQRQEDIKEFEKKISQLHKELNEKGWLQ